MQIGDHAEAVAVIPTGSLALEEALDIGGYPRGRIVEIFGPESGGKTTLALHAVAEAQRAGGIAAFIDTEHALYIRYAKALGVDTEKLLVSQPDSGEQALEIVDLLTRSEVVDLVVETAGAAPSRPPSGRRATPASATAARSARPATRLGEDQNDAPTERAPPPRQRLTS